MFYFSNVLLFKTKFEELIGSLLVVEKNPKTKKYKSSEQNIWVPSSRARNSVPLHFWNTLIIIIIYILRYAADTWILSQTDLSLSLSIHDLADALH